MDRIGSENAHSRWFMRDRYIFWLAMVIVVVAMALVLSSCGSDGGQADPNEGPSYDDLPVEVGQDRHQVENDGSNTEVQTFVVDGTKCVLATSPYEDKIAISCDWSN